MNNYQKLWWEQAKSDHLAFLLLRRGGLAECHSLHYLQMVTEKIAKAYFWRSGSPQSKSHAGFVKFLRFLGQIRPSDRDRIAALFTFTQFADFQNWIRSIALPIAYDLEKLAPTLANDGENPEYPWPHLQPAIAPANHKFDLWARLAARHGRDLMRVIAIAVDRFPEYADT